ncbi:MAG TPA: hypothetical protein VJM74_06725 [Nitrososphaeraceae archaeon]|nr:hypothetical protein [Nitrososphaeraceae archaeon]
MFESIIQQTIEPAAFGVWIPLAFGLAVGLVYAVISGVRHRK